jgi:6,7-dimethyl-8-ribityllumazine synthase
MKAKSRKTAVPVSAHVLIVEARFYDELTDELCAGAREALELAGATHETVTVPGALEVPGAIAISDELRRFDGYVALGVVIRGETGHYDIVAGESARGLMELTLGGLAVGNGILTVDTEAQAWTRAGRKGHNKGAAAAHAALALIRLTQVTEADNGG